MNEMQPLISVIVPAYNAANTIAATLRSISEQEFDDMEIILINDCSTDNTLNEVKQLAASLRLPRLDIINQPQNKGYACGLIAGISAAKGRYITTCDADDTLCHGALKAMADAAQSSNADMVIAPILEHRGNSRRTVRAKRFATLNEMPISTVYFSLCNKMLRRELIISGNCFPNEGKDRWADLAIVARFMTLRPSIKFLDKPSYNYFINSTSGSLTHSAKQQILNDHIDIADSLIHWIDERGVSDEYQEFINHLKFCAKVKLARAPQRDLGKWRNKYPEVNRHILKLRHIPLRYRLLFFLASLPGSHS